jgi:hypothetical protein
MKYMEINRYEILPQTLSQGVDYSPLMVESVVKVLGKEERRPQAIPVAVPPPIFLLRRHATSCFYVFDIHQRPSRNKNPRGYI